MRLEAAGHLSLGCETARHDLHDPCVYTLRILFQSSLGAGGEADGDGETLRETGRERIHTLPGCLLSTAGVLVEDRGPLILTSIVLTLLLGGKHGETDSLLHPSDGEIRTS